MPTLDHREQRELGARVKEGSYYTDAVHLVEVEMIGPTGCVTIRDCCSERARCLAITDFRKHYWLVRARAEEAE